MPLRHKSAQKRARQTVTRTERNKKKYKALIKGAIKRTLSDTDKKSVEEQVKKTTQILDRASVKGIIHKNKVSRIKSKISLHLNKISK
ncbi:MAG: 30S ribosomal protein S20 [Ignavibacteriaceae bacterium]|nr:30S ribosomal protein S20 [Ignavibacteriaceae bacterium]